MAEPARIGGAAAYVTVEELLRARLSAAIGGWRGALESAVPTIAFVVLWTVTKDVRTAVLAAGAALAVLAVLRLMRRETLRFLLYAAVAVAVAAFFALRSGRAEDAFLPGMIQTAAVGLVFAVTNLIRWPLFGFLIAAADPELSEASERLKASSKKGAPQDPETVARAEADEAAVTELLTGWRRHEGVVKVASRVGWVHRRARRDPAGGDGPAVPRWTGRGPRRREDRPGLARLPAGRAGHRSVAAARQHPARRPRRSPGRGLTPGLTLRQPS